MKKFVLGLLALVLFCSASEALVPTRRVAVVRAPRVHNVQRVNVVRVFNRVRVPRVALAAPVYAPPVALSAGVGCGAAPALAAPALAAPAYAPSCGLSASVYSGGVAAPVFVPRVSVRLPFVRIGH